MKVEWSGIFYRMDTTFFSKDRSLIDEFTSCCVYQVFEFCTERARCCCAAEETCRGKYEGTLTYKYKVIYYFFHYLTEIFVSFNNQLTIIIIVHNFLKFFFFETAYDIMYLLYIFRLNVILSFGYWIMDHFILFIYFFWDIEFCTIIFNNG